MLPDLKLPIEDENSAYFWRDEFEKRYSETGDGAFFEAWKIVDSYIEREFDPDDWTF
jgi:hypothetical protein